ncbi:MAG: glycosyltransferase [Saprospiraceae bacterium]
MKTILITAFSVQPYKVGEYGLDWNFIRQIARYQKVIAITRNQNREAIEQCYNEYPDNFANIQFLYYDAKALISIKKIGIIGSMLYYFIWQIGVIGYIKREKLSFDITHNLNFYFDWIPSFLWSLNKPFVWGPVGFQPKIPKQYLKNYNLKYYLIDRISWMAKNYFWNFSLSYYLAKNKAGHIIFTNDYALENVGKVDNYSFLTSVACQDNDWIDISNNAPFAIISAGRFVPLKGFDLGIEAFANFVETLPVHKKSMCHFTLIGEGPEEMLLKKLAKDRNVDHLITFIPSMDQEFVSESFKKASVFIYPSHEGLGTLIADALSFGLPIVCLKNVGPGRLVKSDYGIVVPQGDFDETVHQLSSALADIYFQTYKRRSMRIAARKRFHSSFHWDIWGDQMAKIYAQM